MIRQLTSKPICFTKICILFQSAKHFVKSFLIFLRSFFSTLKSIPDEIRTHTEWILSPMPLPVGLRGYKLTNMSKNLCLLFHKIINTKKPLFFGEGF